MGAMPERRDAGEERARLKAIIAKRSFASGVRVILASGRESTLYFNMKPTMLQAEGAYLIGSLLLDAIAGLGEPVDYVGGIELGAVPIAAAVAATSMARDRPLNALIMRKRAKDHGTQQLLEGLAKDESLAGKRVVVLEDVTTSGGSALQAVEILRAGGGIVEHVITVLDRQEGAGETLAEQGLKLSSLFTAKDFTG